MSNGRYRINVEKFKCGDESGPDWLGSDEPYWVFSARDSRGQVHTHRSQVFGDVDSGDERKFDPKESIVWPAKGDQDGDVAPIAISIQVWEQDQGNPDEVTKRTKQAFDFGGKVPVVGEWVRLVPSVVRDQLARALEDDLMGSNTLLFTAERLARHLPTPGRSFVQKIHFAGRSGDLPFEVAGGPNYYLTYRVTRVS